ncbi:4'-phosphopantetheinyl transferase family protein [Georgenia thermotolerans]|uniref:4-phosphopantetheinyl transferase n=1 Tax=Georgenia thermotolerans TaxID=527326 RepID=A0A7J5URB1_9MICO|nr:4-phosphopantetheinyl transferase [Georgenia thermotolerans]KAE8764965.1 4-phosphopantetheinyl transferase [Georgenia thermotolerans]
MAGEVWWSSLVAADRDVVTLLDGTERARVESLERPADRGRSMVGAALLRVAVAAHLGVGPDEVVVDRTCTDCGQPHGVPRIIGPGGPGPWVSVSHSGVLVVVALSPHGPVGVDVQRESDLPDPRGAQDWVRREAELKAQNAARLGRYPATLPAAVEAGAATRELLPPLDGYAAALTTLGEPVTQHVVRHWPRARGSVVRHSPRARGSASPST